jgi:hypothetical protein
MIKSRKVQVIYRSFEALFGVFAFLVSIGVLSSSGFGKASSTNAYRFFTNLSNWLVILYVFLELIFTIRKFLGGEKEGSSVLCLPIKFSLLIAIALTFVVANTMLGSMMGYFFEAKYWLNFINPFLHLFNPLLFIFDFILFTKRGEMKWTYPLYSLVFPLIYVTVYLIVGAVLGADSNPQNTVYPYPFINVGLIGYGKTFLYIFLLIVVFLIIGYFIYWLDHKLAKNEQKKKPVSE